MLAQTLRRMEADGLVSRTILPGKLPGVEYRLTPLGETLIEPLALIRAWVEEHFAEIEEARARAND
jgi:DNA-binding HxlR family transcriptional regulator